MKKKKIIIFWIILLVGVSHNSISTNASIYQSEPLQVVTSTTLLKDLVSNIGGIQVTLNSILVEGNEDPHTYEPTASEIDALINADIFFC